MPGREPGNDPPGSNRRATPVIMLPIAAPYVLDGPRARIAIAYLSPSTKPVLFSFALLFQSL